MNGQYAALAFNDPFAMGWNLMGLEGYRVTTSFMANLQDVTLIWQLQTAVIVAGHVASVLFAHILSCQIFGARYAVISQIFLALFMVFYTVFGLWMLSTPSMG